MKTIASLVISLAVSISFINIKAQVLDEEIGFIYVKAEYLFETGRYEEAITNYNHVIAKDAKYKNSLVHRGQSKYALAAYKGAKMDAIQSIDLIGITDEAAALLGRAAAALNESDAAIHSFTAAIAVNNKSAQYFEWRATLYESKNQLLKACSDYESAMNLGSPSAEVKARNLCGITKIKTKPKQDTEPKPEVVNKSDNNQPPSVELGEQKPVNPNELGENEVLSSGTKEESGQNNPPTNSDPTKNPNTHVIDDSEPVVDENLPKNDNTINKLTIDDDLTIEISGQELGTRKIKEVPSILILADEDGKVTLNICVNKSGQVTKAEFNANMSSIAKKSLVSLALRKAKEFEFEAGKYDLQCGIIIFHIKGT